MKRLILELIKQDAFYMEFVEYETPWSPSFEDFEHAFVSFRKEIAQTFSNDIFCAFSLEIPKFYKTTPPETAKLIAYHDGEESFYIFFEDLSLEFQEKCQYNNVEIIKSELSASKWLWSQIKTNTNSKLSKFFNNWKKRTKVDNLFFAPYIVRKNDKIKECIVDTQENTPRWAYETLSESQSLNEFLYTEVEPIDTNWDFTNPDNDWYLWSDWIFGIPNSNSLDYDELIFTLQVATISFQMSWGYPELMKERQRKQDEILRREESEKENLRNTNKLQRREEAINVAHKFMEPVRIAYDLTRKFLNVMTPLPTQLEIKYTFSSDYFVEVEENDNGVMYHKNPNWIFLHKWTDDKIKLNPEAFRAQFSCILLLFKGESKDVKVYDVWNEKKGLPWIQIESLPKNFISLFEYMFKETYKKITTQDQSKFDCLDWNPSDAKAFTILRGCFHYPFKKNKKNRERVDYTLTGPLLILWALEFGSLTSIDEESYKNLTRTKHIEGENWMPFEFLVGLHGIYYHFREYCKIEISAERNRIKEKRKLSIDIVLRDCRELSGFSEEVEQAKKSAENPNLDSKKEFARGGTEYSIKTILGQNQNNANIFCDVPNKLIKISFEIDES